MELHRRFDGLQISPGGWGLDARASLRVLCLARPAQRVRVPLIELLSLLGQACKRRPSRAGTFITAVCRPGTDIVVTCGQEDLREWGSAGVLRGSGAGRGAFFEPTELLKDCLEVAVQSVAACTSITVT